MNLSGRGKGLTYFQKVIHSAGKVRVSFRFHFEIVLSLEDGSLGLAHETLVKRLLAEFGNIFLLMIRQMRLKLFVLILGYFYQMADANEGCVFDGQGLCS